MIKFLICLSILAIALIFFNRSKKKQMRAYIEKIRIDSLKKVRVDNINHIIRNKRNNIVLVYPFGKIELEPGQLVFVEQIRSECILIPKAEVKFKYKKVAGVPIFPQGITDREIRGFYLNNLTVYILKERFHELMI